MPPALSRQRAFEAFATEGCAASVTGSLNGSSALGAQQGALEGAGPAALGVPRLAAGGAVSLMAGPRPEWMSTEGRAL